MALTWPRLPSRSVGLTWVVCGVYRLARSACLTLGVRGRGVDVHVLGLLCATVDANALLGEAGKVEIPAGCRAPLWPGIGVNSNPIFIG